MDLIDSSLQLEKAFPETLICSHNLTFGTFQRFSGFVQKTPSFFNTEMKFLRERLCFSNKLGLSGKKKL